MEPENQTLVTQIKMETAESPVTISYRRRNVDMYYVFGQELDAIGSSSIQSSLHLAFFGAAFGAALSLWVTIATVEIIKPRTYGAFFAAALLSTVMAIYFLIRSVIDWRYATQHVKTIKEASPKREIQS